METIDLSTTISRPLLAFTAMSNGGRHDTKCYDTRKRRTTELPGGYPALASFLARDKTHTLLRRVGGLRDKTNLRRSELGRLRQELRRRAGTSFQIEEGDPLCFRLEQSVFIGETSIDLELCNFWGDVRNCICCNGGQTTHPNKQIEDNQTDCTFINSDCTTGESEYAHRNIYAFQSPLQYSRVPEIYTNPSTWARSYQRISPTGHLLLAWLVSMTFISKIHALPTQYEAISGGFAMALNLWTATLVPMKSEVLNIVVWIIQLLIVGLVLAFLWENKSRCESPQGKMALSLGTVICGVSLATLYAGEQFLTCLGFFTALCGFLIGFVFDHGKEWWSHVHQSFVDTRKYAVDCVASWYVALWTLLDRIRPQNTVTGSNV